MDFRLQARSKSKSSHFFKGLEVWAPVSYVVDNGPILGAQTRGPWDLLWIKILARATPELS